MRLEDTGFDSHFPLALLQKLGNNIYPVKTWFSTLETVHLCRSDEKLKAVGPFYLVSMPGEVKDPTTPAKKS